MLKNHTILYDAECPLCSLYTGAFVKCGMLEADGREEFAEALKSPYIIVDWKRAGTEIPLIDHRHKTVTYGIDSLFKILGHRFPVLKPLFGLRIFRWIMRHFYFLISYNRKVIAPSAVFEEQASCKPKMNIPYRIAFILLACAATSVGIASYSKLFMIPISSLSAAALCSTVILAMALIVSRVRRERLIYYLGNLMTVFLIGILSFLPCHLLSNVITSPAIHFGWLTLCVAIMAVIHDRRVRNLGLPRLVTLAWLLILYVGIALVQRG